MWNWIVYEEEDMKNMYIMYDHAGVYDFHISLITDILEWNFMNGLYIFSSDWQKKNIDYFTIIGWNAYKTKLSEKSF